MNITIYHIIAASLCVLICGAQAADAEYTVPANDIPLTMADIYCDGTYRTISIKTRAEQVGLKTKRVPTTRIRVEGAGGNNIDPVLRYPIGFEFLRVIPDDNGCEGMAGVLGDGTPHVIDGYHACALANQHIWEGYGVVSTPPQLIWDWLALGSQTITIVYPGGESGTYKNGDNRVHCDMQFCRISTSYVDALVPGKTVWTIHQGGSVINGIRQCFTYRP